MDKYKKNLSEIQNNSILIYSGIQRESSTVTKNLVSQIKQKTDVYENLFNSC